MAQRSVCLSNIRQMGLGYHTYASNQQQWWPDGSGYSHNTSVWKHTPTWPRVIAWTLSMKYTTEQPQNANHVPFAPEQIVPGSLGAIKNNSIFQCPADTTRNSSGGNHATSYAANQTALGIADSYFFHATQKHHAPIKDSAILKPSSTFVLGETNRLQSPGWTDYNSNQFTRGNTMLGEDVYKYAGEHHLGSGNYLWADGHANTMKPPELLNEHFYENL